MAVEGLPLSPIVDVASSTCQLLAVAGLLLGQPPEPVLGPGEDPERVPVIAIGPVPLVVGEGASVLDGRPRRPWPGPLRVAELVGNRPLVTHDPFVRAEGVARFSFETDEDRDFDEQPDDWTRRSGEGFPHYVKAGIDRRRGRTGRSSLRFDVNGGRAVYYSPQIRIDSLHTFLFEGFVRTQLLEHDAAVITVSLLDHERRRVQRFESKPVTGTHSGWVRLRIGPMTPRADVRFAVIACHLLHGPGGRDFHGAVWFDDLWLGRTPRLSLESNFHAHFVQPDVPIEVRAKVGGIEAGEPYVLVLTLHDASGDVVDQTRRDVVREPPPATRPRNAEEDERPIEVAWSVPPRDYGFYHVRAVLSRNGEAVLEEATSLAVMDLVENGEAGEFGWTIPAEAVANVDTRELADVVSQAGVHWLKQPVWRLATDGATADVLQAARLFDELRRKNVRVVGVLEDPPDALRRKFAKNWTGVSEAFTMPTDLWAPSLEPVLARYSSYIGYWQLGGDDDSSFVGLDTLDETLAAVKGEFDRVGRDSRIGVRWTWDAELPVLPNTGRSFLSILEREPIPAEELADRLEASRAAPLQRWVVIKPAARSDQSLDARAADLLKRITHAKVAGANGVFAYDVFDPEHGLLNPDGSPTPMFLPWRTAATALSGAEYLGSLLLPAGSTNHLFAKDGEVIMVLWNDSPEAVVEPAVEEFFVGPDAYLVDPWGRTAEIPTDPGTNRQRIEVGPQPVLVRGGVEAVARWRLATRFENGRFDSATGQQAEAVLTRNTFPQGVSGKATLVLSRQWKADPAEWPIQVGAGEAIRLPTFLELPQNATLGDEPVAIDFEITADRVYRFRVTRTFQIGLGDIDLVVLDRKLPDGRLEIEQVITNATSPLEVLDLECSLFVPGYKRRRQLVNKLGAGEDRRFYHLPNADALKGKRLWLRAKQENGRRVLNFKWTVGENWDRDEAARRINRGRTRLD